MALQDNRCEVVALRKFQRASNTSMQAKQLTQLKASTQNANAHLNLEFVKGKQSLQQKANITGQPDRSVSCRKSLNQQSIVNGKTIQKATEISFQQGNLHYWAGGLHFGDLTVGVDTDAYLDPANPKTGSRTAAAPTPSPYTNGNWPKLYQGHLLNANLGGQAIPQNLFPVTPAFNGQHSSIFEDHVKAHLMNLNSLKIDPAQAANNIHRRLHYRVRVQNPNMANFHVGDIHNTVFNCEMNFTKNNATPHGGTGVDNNYPNVNMPIQVPAPPDNPALNAQLDNLGWGPDNNPSYQLGPLIAPNVHQVVDAANVAVPNMTIRV